MATPDDPTGREPDAPAAQPQAPQQWPPYAPAPGGGYPQPGGYPQQQHPGAYPQHGQYPLPPQPPQPGSYPQQPQQGPHPQPPQYPQPPQPGSYPQQPQPGAYPQQGPYPQPPQYSPYPQPTYPAYPAYAPRSYGTVSWAIGFLVFIPWLGMLVAPVTMLIVGTLQRAKGGVAAGNGRRAANWALTYLLVLILLVIGFITCVIVAATADGTNRALSSGMGIAAGVCALLLFAPGIAHVVLIIIGTVKATGGKVFRNPLAIGFIRAGADESDA